jgi:hypothetical protein
MKALLAAVLLAATAGCAAGARAPAAPAPLDPVGRYEFSTLYQGQPLAGTIEVTGTEGAYGGVLRATGIPDLPLQSVEVEGRELRIAAGTPDGTLALRLVFAAGAEFTGGWTLGADSGELVGRRLP